MSFTQIQIRRDNTENWTANNPLLADGEIAIDSSLKKIKIGDGSNNWNELTFANDSESIILYLSPIDTDIVSTTKSAIINSLPYNLEVNELSIEVDLAPTDSNIEVDINIDGVSFFKVEESIHKIISIDATETSSTTATTAYVIDTDTFPNGRIPKGSTISVDIDQVGATVPGQNLILTINGARY